MSSPGQFSTTSRHRAPAAPRTPRQQPPAWVYALLVALAVLALVLAGLALTHDPAVPDTAKAHGFTARR